MLRDTTDLSKGHELSRSTGGIPGSGYWGSHKHVAEMGLEDGSLLS